MFTLEPKALSISKSRGKFFIQTPQEVEISYEKFSQLTNDEKIDSCAFMEDEDLVQEKFWQAYLASEQEWEEVYRRLAES